MREKFIAPTLVALALTAGAVCTASAVPGVSWLRPSRRRSTKPFRSNSDKPTWRERSILCAFSRQPRSSPISITLASQGRPSLK